MISSKPRCKRGPSPEKIRRRQYRRDSLPSLVRDFKNRCAYSDIHERYTTGIGGMDVDHFDPTQKNDLIQKYSNLFLSCKPCNNAKWSHWPSSTQRNAGIRYLNPCMETEFPHHYVENHQTGELIGKTPAGKYHIRKLALNSKFLCKHRKDRYHLRKMIKEKKIRELNPSTRFQDVYEPLMCLIKIADDMIMDIPSE